MCLRCVSLGCLTIAFTFLASTLEDRPAVPLSFQMSTSEPLILLHPVCYTKVVCFVLYLVFESGLCVWPRDIFEL